MTLLKKWKKKKFYFFNFIPLYFLLEDRRFSLRLEVIHGGIFLIKKIELFSTETFQVLVVKY
jgi:hypothetical protein